MHMVTLALAGSIPIITVFTLMAGLRWSAAKAMVVGWLAATGLGLLLWQMETGWWAAAALYGALQAVEIILIVFGAVLLMNHLKASGAITTIRQHIALITRDRRVQMLLIGLGFMTLIEGAAGFGTPGALAAPLLLGFGFPPIAAAVFGLFFNAAQPPLGAVGAPIIGGIASVLDRAQLGDAIDAAVFLQQVTTWTAALTGAALVLWGLLGVFLLLYWFGDDRERTLAGAWAGLQPVLPFALLLGAVAGGIQFLVAHFFGPELPNIVAGFVALGVGVFLAQRNYLIPGQPWRFLPRAQWPQAWLGGLDPDEGVQTPATASKMPVWLAWTPYVLAAVILLITRWPGLGVRAALQPFALEIPRILGQDLSFSLNYLYLPGVIPFIPVAVLTAFIHRMSAADMLGAWQTSLRQIGPVAVTLIIAVSMTQIMIRSGVNLRQQPGMMEALSQLLAQSAGQVLPFIAPWLGALGAFITGSSTSSNILFSVLQHDAAADVAVSRTLAVALQNVGSGIGNMISILNIAAICGVLYMTGKEGELLRKTILPTVLYGVAVGLAGLILARLLTGLY